MAEHVLPVRVYFEDTDAGGVVYHTGYLRFAERGRTELLRSLGFDHRTLQARQGLAFAVRSLEAEYLRPARLDDALEVRTRIAGASGARVGFRQAVCRAGETLADMRVQIVCLRSDGRPARVPPSLRRVAAAGES